eukprot:jgi/Mesen1/4990/ME000248S04271
MAEVAASDADAQPPPIRKLEEAVVNRIAAGEVIQRPASALKELIENSLDAGSTSISVVIKEGGLKLIQITDNGHGIRREDLPIVCERHTTSKLREFEDLQSIATMGFRGEALSSMSFVAHLTITTMTAGQTHGYRATYKDGKMEGEARPCAAVKGTQITVENLFYNVVARRRAFRNPGEEYARILDVVTRFAAHRTDVSFSCKKHGETRADIHTVAGAARVDAIKAVYGPSVGRDLIPVAASASPSSPSSAAAAAAAACADKGGGNCEANGFPATAAMAGEGCEFAMEGLISSANYSAKKTTMVLFINERMVECSALKRACEAVYAAILPKASKPFLYLAITLPPRHVDVNVHPTKREVSFLNQEALVDAIQKAVEACLCHSNTSRTFYTQTLLPGASPVAERDDEDNGHGSQQATGGSQQQVRQPEHKLVRTDARNQAGALHAFVQPPNKRSAEEGPSLAATRRAVRQRRNPAAGSELTSVQELLAAMDRHTHSGLSEIVKHNSYVGMADDVLALLQHNTRLYLVNVVTLSKEVVYQQVLRRFAHFNAMKFSAPAPLRELLLTALDDEERSGRWQESDGPKDEIASLNVELLQCKAEMLREYFAIHIDDRACLLGLPLVLDHYTPDLDRLPNFVLALANNVDWDTETECFDTIAAAIADFYALHPPLVPRPPPKKKTKKGGGQQQKGSHLSGGAAGMSLEEDTPPVEIAQAAALAALEGESMPDSDVQEEAESTKACHTEEEEEENGKEAKGKDEEKGEGKEKEEEGKEAEGDEKEKEGEKDEEEDAERELMEEEAEVAWAQREWTLQHLFLPAMKFFLKPPKHMANDGTFVQVACLENLYKVFERC